VISVSSFIDDIEKGKGKRRVLLRYNFPSARRKTSSFIDDIEKGEASAGRSQSD